MPSAADAGAPGRRISRRDFLAGAGAVALGTPMAARAAFAQEAAATPPVDRAIASLAVYPALGIARVGNGAEWFLGPEVPGLPALADGSYKSDDRRIKKQAQRFRVYAFNAAGEVLREVTAAEARIEWTVHVANTKAAWYGFSNPLDNGDLAPGLPGKKRNDAIVDNADRADMLVIDPGPRSIAGPAVNPDGADPAFALTGRFWRSLEVPLGHLRTDDAGRLLVFPADGVSRSAVPNNPIVNFADNDGWHDDWCDGVVQARVVFGDGTAREADHAWVACCGPDFAPGIPPVVSLYDVLTEVALDAGWLAPPPRPVSFRKHVYPFFRRLALMEWVANAANLAPAWLAVGDFADPAFVARLADPSPANRAFRDDVLARIRDPRNDDQQQYALPYMLGDGVNYEGSPLRWLRLPQGQYDLLLAWAAGEFVADLDLGGQETVARIEDLPLAEQPDALTRAALEPCSGGAFHPGVELTWPLRHRALYRAPYRIALADDRDPGLIQDLGLLLGPEQAFGGHDGVPPAVAPQMPGDLTRWMGLPWQGDAFSCQQVLFANDFPVATWWPALLPIDVLPEVFYRAAMDPALDPADRLTLSESRVAWSRGVAGVGYHAEASYTDGISRMIDLWTRMGFVVARPGPTDPGRPPSIPEVLYVEVDRGSVDLAADGEVPAEAPDGGAPAR